MKTASLILLLAACVLLRCIAYASVANLAPQRSSGNSTVTTDAGSVHSTETGHATVSSQRKDQKEATARHQRADRRHVYDKTRKNRLASPSKRNRPKQVQNNHEHSIPKDVRNMHQQAPTKPSVAATKVVKIHTPSVRPATGVAISGQQFRNGRNGSATPAVIGGPANKRRNAEAINGTEVNRKHLH